jgi:hypothetical protein
MSEYRFNTCDFCDTQVPAPYEVCMPRPSDPYDYACVMAACEACATTMVVTTDLVVGESALAPFPVWEAWCEDNGFFHS